MDLKGLAISTFRDEADAILNLGNQLTDDFEKVAQAIMNLKGRLIITGVGKSGLIGGKMAATFASTGTPSFFIHPVEAFHGDLGMITSEDIVMTISYSGATDEVLRLVPHLEERNIPIIALTGNPESLLATHATYHLNISVEKEACPLNLAPTSSTTATLAMGDALAVALMHLRNFREEDFARFHPGGNLGYRLLTKVKDVMRKENLPLVSPTMKISDAIIEISNAKLGLVVIAQGDEIQGIITDGDIRRTMQKYQEKSFHMEVEKVMTLNPVSINENAKVIDAENLMKRHNIHALLVLDADRRLAGILDSFRL
jgi:arabinose-5-phosphate isomerase